MDAAEAKNSRRVDVLFFIFFCFIFSSFMSIGLRSVIGAMVQYHPKKSSSDVFRAF